VTLNRENFDPATVQLTSSNPAIAPVPASLTLPSLTQAGRFPILQRPGVISTGRGGHARDVLGFVRRSHANRNVIIPKTVDTVQITRAELVVKTGSLRVEATGSNPAAALVLFNAATGQQIGTMTNTGLSGQRGEIFVPGEAPPVTTVLVRSSLNGTATSAVVQK